LSTVLADYKKGQVKGMDVGVIVAIVGLVGSAVTGVIGYATGRGKDKISDRELLSKDEQAFRKELRAELRANKEKIEKLSDEIVILRRENMELVAENRSLNAKVEQLVERLSRRTGDGRYDDQTS
jgi:predicted RNase H-like nuclease (RuvC/YqgF family)